MRGISGKCLRAQIASTKLESISTSGSRRFAPGLVAVSPCAVASALKYNRGSSISGMTRPSKSFRRPPGGAPVAPAAFANASAPNSLTNSLQSRSMVTEPSPLPQIAFLLQPPNQNRPSICSGNKVKRSSGISKSNAPCCEMKARSRTRRMGLNSPFLPISLRVTQEGPTRDHGTGCAISRAACTASWRWVIHLAATLPQLVTPIGSVAR
mmetsp:Transcript_143773/g.267907  ORF Transcript_143773/g.267907 Transcript_143773/m.267907 type:complete len:210 (-) Transcript_143773:167-796(-)